MRWITPASSNPASSRLPLRLVTIAEGLPVLRPIFETAYRRYFESVTGHARLFRGVFADFTDATQAIPAGRLHGYDNASSAHRVSDERFRIFPCDYPVMFWLRELLPECRRLLDWGGNIGISYFAYRKYLSYPDGFEWLVSDVPAVVAAGRDIALNERAPGLRFTSILTELVHSDVLLAAGSLHYIADPIAELREQPSLPRHLLFNKVPAYELPAAVTLQNIGTSFCPNHLFNRNSFVQQFEELGYKLIDEWRSPDLSCRIPFFREHCIPAYSGFYFRKPVADSQDPVPHILQKQREADKNVAGEGGLRIRRPERAMHARPQMNRTHIVSTDVDLNLVPKGTPPGKVPDQGAARHREEGNGSGVIAEQPQPVDSALTKLHGTGHRASRDPQR